MINAKIIKMKKNLALRDSPPAADRFSDIISLRRSAVLPGGLFSTLSSLVFYLCRSRPELVESGLISP